MRGVETRESRGNSFSERGANAGGRDRDRVVLEGHRAHPWLQSGQDYSDYRHDLPKERETGDTCKFFLFTDATV